MVEVTFSLGQSLYGQGRYREAMEKFREANALRSDDSSIINYLGIALVQAEHYTEAEPYLNRALAIREKSLGADHPSTAKSLHNLAELYRTQRKYAEAEPLFIRALAIREKSLGPDHALTAITLNNLAGLYVSQDKYKEAEPLLERALAIHEKAARSSNHRHKPQQSGRTLSYTRQVRRGRAALQTRPCNLGEIARRRSSEYRHNTRQPGEPLQITKQVRGGRAALQTRSRHH